MDVLKLEEIYIELKKLQSTLILIECSTYSNDDVEFIREALELVNKSLYDNLSQLNELKNNSFIKHKQVFERKLNTSIEII